MPYSGNPTVARFKTDMKDMAAQLGVDLHTNMLQQADELIQNMRGAVPVKSGALRNSIRKKDVSQTYGNRQRVSVLVMAGGKETTRRSGAGVVYDYALGTEFGTVHERPEPFFYSSARLYAQQGRESARETVDEAIAENNRVRELRSENYSNAGITASVGGRGGAVVIRGKI